MTPEMTIMVGCSRPGMSNIRPGGQNWSSKDANPAHWTTLENVKQGINIELLNIFSDFLYMWISTIEI